MRAVISRRREGLLCGVRPPSMNSPGGCPGAISMSSGSKKLGAAVLARTICASGRCRLPVNNLSAGVSQNAARIICDDPGAAGVHALENDAKTRAKIGTVERPCPDDFGEFLHQALSLIHI